MAKKDTRISIILECTEKAGSSRYMTQKSKKNTPDRIVLKKYNPVLKKVTEHKEIK